MTYTLHPSKYIFRSCRRRKFRPKKPGDFRRAVLNLHKVANDELDALSIKHGRKIVMEGLFRVIGFNHVCWEAAYAFYDQN